MSFYTACLRPLFFRFDPESIHHFSMGMMAHTPLAMVLSRGDAAPSRPVEVFGLKFRNPLGLAAGFDKNAEVIEPMRTLGFGFVEVGTITRHAQPGNPKPRIFRCPAQQGVVNRMGFPNLGAEAVGRNIAAWRAQHGSPEGFPVGINIGKSKVTSLEEAADDYAFSFDHLYDLGDFFVINVSSPNTPGLRNLQAPEFLGPIFAKLQEINRSRSSKPLLVKIAPDLEESQIADVLQLISSHSLAGIVATNTTIDHSSIPLKETGGLSGRPLTRRSTEVIRFISRETGGKLPIIGAGGIFTRDDAREKMDAGASLVQVYTGFIYQGPRIAWELLPAA